MENRTMSSEVSSERRRFATLERLSFGFALDACSGQPRSIQLSHAVIIL